MPDGEPEPAGSLRAAYAAMLESVDQSVGRVIAKLEQLGIERDTLVIVTSDNGAVEETPDTGQIDHPQRSAARRQSDSLRGWPARAAPGAMAGGGGGGTGDRCPDRHHRLVPDAARCRRRGRSESGVAGGDSLTGDSLDGVSLLPLLRADDARIERSLHFHYPHYIAGYRPRPGSRDLVEHPRRGGALGLPQARSSLRWRLRALRPGQRSGRGHDLAADRPADARRLEDDLARWLESEGAHLPRSNAAYDPGAFARDLADSLAALGGSSEWTPNGGCTHRLAGGKLELDCVETPFIMSPELVVSGPLRVAVRFTSSETRGGPLLWYRSASKPQFDGDRVTLDPARESGVHQGRIEREETVRQLRIDFGRNKGGRVAVDWFRLYAPTNDSAPLAQWSFDAAEARPRSASPVSSDQPLD